MQGTPDDAYLLQRVQKRAVTEDTEEEMSVSGLVRVIRADDLQNDSFREYGILQPQDNTILLDWEAQQLPKGYLVSSDRALHLFRGAEGLTGAEVNAPTTARYGPREHVMLIPHARITSMQKTCGE